jgi:cell division septation protein DedD
MTDIGSRAPRRRPGYAWLAVGPVAAAGAIAMFIACQPAVASTPPDLGSAGNLAGLGNVGGLSGLGDTSGLAGMNGTGDTGDGHRHRHHGGDHCGCMSPATTPATTMAPTPTQTTPVPVSTTATPVPTETTTTPVPTETTTTPTPIPTGHRPPPAPVPVPVGNNFPVTG